MAGNVLSLSKAGFYPIYVLILLLAAYLLNQLDRYALAITSQPMAREIKFGDKGCLPFNTSLGSKVKTFCVKSYKDKDKTERNETACKTKGLSRYNNSQICTWDYDGTGEQYQILAGPVFIVVYTLSGVILGLFTGTFNRKNILIFCLLLWSGMTLLTGFAKQYWHLLLARFILGIGEAGCTPFATSMIADYFSENLRGAALGVYNWGIYIGYSMAFAFGNYITNANINGQGWRWVFFIAAIPGFAVGLLMIFTMREPQKREAEIFDSSKLIALKIKLLLMLKTFLRPSLILLFMAGSIRNAGGYVWAYNTQPYFNKYYPDTDVGKYMSWIPLVGGSMGVVFGGFISDRLVKDRGSYARIWVLVVSQVVAAPFAAGALFLKPPWAFISLIPSNIIGEMWVGVTLAVVVELVPNTIRTASVAYYLFVISIIGGNVPLLVPVIKASLGLRNALYILFPGLYVVSSVIFLVTLFVLKRDLQRVVDFSDVNSPLLPGSPKEESDKLI